MESTRTKNVMVEHLFVIHCKEYTLSYLADSLKGTCNQQLTFSKTPKLACQQTVQKVFRRSAKDSK